MKQRRTFWEGVVDRITSLWIQNNPDEPTEDSDTETRAPYIPASDANPTVWSWYNDQVQLDRNRLQRYKDYDAMDDESPEVSSALDIYADNATASDSETNNVVLVNTDNEVAKKVLQDTVKALCLDSESWSIARNIAKYGESFEEIVADQNMVLYRLKNLEGDSIIRNEDRYGRLEERAFTQLDKEDNRKIAEFLKWQVVHFRIKKKRNSRYGEGILAPARKVWTQLTMMEDAMVIARLTRAHNRFKYLIDTNGMTPDERLSYIDKVKRGLRKRKTIDPRTGKMDTSFNPLSVEEDVFLAVTKEGKADVGVLTGQGSGGGLEDVEYFQNKMFSALKVPKAYVGLERDINAKATLTEQDVQFARTVRRIQLAMQTGYRQILDLALAIAGFNPNDVEYQVGLPIISTIDEMRKWEIEKIKMEVTNEFRGQFRVDDRYILRALLGYSDSEIDELYEARVPTPDLDELGRKKPGVEKRDKTIDWLMDLAKMEAEMKIQIAELQASAGQEFEIDLSNHYIDQVIMLMNKPLDAQLAGAGLEEPPDEIELIGARSAITVEAPPTPEPVEPTEPELEEPMIPKEAYNPRKINKLKRKLQYELEALDELTKWQLEDKRLNKR